MRFAPDPKATLHIPQFHSSPPRGCMGANTLRPMKRLYLLCAAALTVAACDSSSDFAPVDVAGQYAGMISISESFVGQVKVTSGPARIMATQSRNEVTVNGHLVLDSANAGYFRYVEFTLPTLEGRINKDGIFTPFEGGLIMDTGWIDTHCGKADECQ